MSFQSPAQVGFTGNQLKLIAVISMTLDHIGMMLFPQLTFLRILGRLALPIYAYMIAEGCRHTRDRRKYLLRIAGLGLLCQTVYFVAMGSLYQCILITFSLSICLIWSVEYSVRKGTLSSRILAFAVLAVILVLTELVPRLPTGTDFDIDYGLIGVLLPALVYFGSEKTKYLTVGLLLLGIQNGGIQWAALAAVPLLGMYNGTRGSGTIGKWFYLYYPLHLVVLQGLSMIL